MILLQTSSESVSPASSLPSAHLQGPLTLYGSHSVPRQTLMAVVSDCGFQVYHSRCSRTQPPQEDSWDQAQPSHAHTPYKHLHAPHAKGTKRQY